MEGAEVIGSLDNQRAHWRTGGRVGSLHGRVESHLHRHHRHRHRCLLEDLHQGRRGGMEVDHPDLQHHHPAQDRRQAVVVAHPDAHPARQHHHSGHRHERPL